MTTSTNLSHSASTVANPIKIGAVVGLVGGAFIGLAESGQTLLTILNSVLPSTPNTMDMLALLSGLFFITALYAIGGAIGLAVLGGLLIGWQSLRGSKLGAAQLVTLHGTALVFGYTLFVTLDRLGIQELMSTGRSSALVLGLTLLGQAAFIGLVAWFLISSVAEKWQQQRPGWLRPLRWNTARNLAGALLILLLILPLSFAGFRWVNQARGERVVRAAAAATAERPNIIYVTIDALRADHLGAYGYEKARTPNIDAFAAEGVLFEEMNSQASWTFPSFASQFTSMYPTDLNLSVDNKHISNMYTRFVDDKYVTMAEAVQAAGYRTQAIATNPWLRPEFGFAQGFDGFKQVDDAKMFHFSKLGELSLLSVARQVPALYDLIRQGYTAITGNAGEPLVWDIRADRVTAEATGWLRQNQDAPFFLWVHYVDPHYPFDPPADFRPTVDNVTAERLNYLSSYNEEDVYTNRARLRPEDKEATIQLYDGEIAYNDVYFGQLLDEIDALGLRDNTVIVLSADHGDEFWEHDGYQHGHTLYDELIRVPLIIRGPGAFAEPRRVTDDVQAVDLLPTFVELAGGTIPEQVRGRSLLPLLQGQSEPVYNFAEALFLGVEQKAVRGQGFKLIHNLYDDQYELYNLEQDPDEQNNLVDQEPDQVEKLQIVLRDWRRSLGESDETGVGSTPSNTGRDPSMVHELLDDAP